MEFLRNQFHDELNSDGEIEIAGSRFQPSRILAELENQTYQVAFGDWLTNHRQKMMERALEILEEHEQTERFQTLKRVWKGGQLIPFVGAGLSIPCGYPGWTSLLWRLQKFSDVPADELDKILQSGQYELAAQMLHDSLGSAAFDERLQSIYEKDFKLSGPVQYLPRLFKSHVVTTNFDAVLESLFEDSPDSEQGFDRIVLGRSLGEVPRLISAGGRLLIKIHGSCQDVANRVVLTSEYDEAYSDAGNVQQFFHGFLFARPLLFLGCSLITDRTLQEMAKVVTKIGPSKLPRHYAILELNIPEERPLRERNLAKANIFPIWYPKGQHQQSIEALLVALLEEL